MQFEKITTQVLVIGGGGAAMRAALEANAAGAEVLMLSKGAAGYSGATYYSVAEIGAFNIPDGGIDKTDNPEAYYNDMMAAAQGAANPKLVRILAEEAQEHAKNYLEKHGLELARSSGGGYLGYRACFSTRARSYIIKDHFKPIMKVLREQLGNTGVKIMSPFMVTGLLVKDGECFGALAIDCKTFKGYRIYANSVVVTTGGASTMFVHHMYPDDVTGDGYAIARRAGATMTNMEFLQAGLGLAHPKINLIGNQLWELEPRLANGKNESFVEKYIDNGCSVADVISDKGKHFPFSVIDNSRFVEIGIQREMLAGNVTPNGNVYLDFTAVDFKGKFAASSRLKEMWPLTYDRFKSYGIDVYTQKLEIAVFAHCVNGGILIDENAESSIKGLFAAGETAAGPHGADRLGGNMSVTCQVFGRRAGLAAASRAKKAGKVIEDETIIKGQKEYLAGFKDMRQEEISALKAELKKTVEENLLIIRNEQGLSKLLRALSEASGKLKGGGNTEASESLLRTLELANLVESARLMTSAALARKESRGSHYRSDFPNKDERLAHQIII